MPQKAGARDKVIVAVEILAGEHQGSFEIAVEFDPEEAENVVIEAISHGHEVTVRDGVVTKRGVDWFFGR